MGWTTKMEDLSMLTTTSVSKRNDSIVPSTVEFIKLPEVISITHISRSSIYLLEKAGKFPQAVLVGKRSVRYVKSEILQWCVDRMAERSTVGEL